MAYKRRRGHDALADTVNIITIDDDDDVVEEEHSGAGENYWSLAKAQLSSMWELLSYQRKELFNSAGHGTSFSDIPIYNTDAPDDDDWNDDDFQIPVGEEGAMHSNAGGEFDYHNFLDTLLSEAPSRIDMRERHHRTERQNQSWERQLPRLVDAYLLHQSHGAPDPGDDDLCEGQPWTIARMDLYEYCYLEDIRHVHGSQTANETLAFYGYLGGSPDDPTIAFPFKFLETFRQIHRVCPRFSISGLSCTLTNTHGRFPMPHLEQQLRVAYDTYLSIKREVQLRVDNALGRDSHSHFVRNVCPPCTYQLENEVALTPTILMAMDGNNSLKLVDASKRYGRARLDTRRLRHPRWLDAKFVDEFQDEVANARRKGPNPTSKPINTGSGSTDGSPEPDDRRDTWLTDDELDDLAGIINPCVERWKAAGPEANKKMFSFFAISGIFLSVCRHGHVLVICDMRRSGELMKYPLAIVKALLDRYGKDLGLGYDIMCAFYRTLLRSEKLGNQVVAFRLKGVVPAFHGHAHNRRCQVSWHPMYTQGVGLEDFEECERTFSESNHLASTTRLASEFHRHQSLMEHFDFHDVDKHIASGNFIFQNYRQALLRIEADEPLFQDLCERQGISQEDCERFLQEEIEHFSKEHKEPPDVAMRLDYVELLQKLTKQKAASDDAYGGYQSAQRSKQVTAKQLQSLHTRSRTTLDRYRSTLEEVLDFENEHDFYRRWKPTDQEYIETLSAMRARNYRRALERLERLVVQRLLELTKLNMSGTGYKQREKITQALRARAKAIQKALDEYNETASAMNPPRPRLDWKDILEMVTLADFDLLKDTHLDLTNVAWAQPLNRESIRLYFGLKRAREEITRLNVEIRRLISFMIDNYADHVHAFEQAIEQGNDQLAMELSERMTVMNEIDGHIAIRLVQTSELKGFSGTLVPGRKKDRDPSITDSARLPGWATMVLGLTRTYPPQQQGQYSTSAPTVNLSELAPEGNMEDADTEGLLDYFEGISIDKSKSHTDV
ncbi:hypothetical protein PM082_006941 [Marasmius tenuissimus]|nr:hypothetical protein PM082_006941 [Marasmius tenuissimus]